MTMRDQIVSTLKKEYEQNFNEAKFSEIISRVSAVIGLDELPQVMALTYFEKQRALLVLTEKRMLLGYEGSKKQIQVEEICYSHVVYTEHDLADILVMFTEDEAICLAKISDSGYREISEYISSRKNQDGSGKSLIKGPAQKTSTAFSNTVALFPYCAWFSCLYNGIRAKPLKYLFLAAVWLSLSIWVYKMDSWLLFFVFWIGGVFFYFWIQDNYSKELAPVLQRKYQNNWEKRKVLKLYPYQRMWN